MAAPPRRWPVVTPAEAAARARAIGRQPNARDMFGVGTERTDAALVNAWILSWTSFFY
jgi:hypothetical protein